VVEEFRRGPGVGVIITRFWQLGQAQDHPVIGTHVGQRRLNGYALVSQQSGNKFLPLS
jgi:hypothetical protein